jgi:hypothetical protein
MDSRCAQSGFADGHEPMTGVDECLHITPQLLHPAGDVAPTLMGWAPRL